MVLRLPAVPAMRVAGTRSRRRPRTQQSTRLAGQLRIRYSWCQSSRCPRCYIQRGCWRSRCGDPWSRYFRCLRWSLIWRDSLGGQDRCAPETVRGHVVFAEIRRVHHHHVFPPQPWRVGCWCHLAIWTAPRTAEGADTCATECEATAAVRGTENAVDAETTCLAVHMRAVDLGRIVAEATLREQSAAAGPNAGIRAEVGVRRSGREKH